MVSLFIGREHIVLNVMWGFISDDEDEPEGITIQQWNTRTRKPKAYRK